jgi:hypothetical protein
MEKKITEEQLTKIQGQQQELNQVIHEIGLLESQKHALLHKIAGINEDVETLKSELENQYGAININVEDGTYTEIEKKEEEEVLENV